MTWPPGQRPWPRPRIAPESLHAQPRKTSRKQTKLGGGPASLRPAPRSPAWRARRLASASVQLVQQASEFIATTATNSFATASCWPCNAPCEAHSNAA